MPSATKNSTELVDEFVIDDDESSLPVGAGEDMLFWLVNVNYLRGRRICLYMSLTAATSAVPILTPVTVHHRQQKKTQPHHKTITPPPLDTPT